MINALSVGELSSILKACFENPKFSSLPVYGEVLSIRGGKFTYIEIGDQGKGEISAPILKCAFSSFDRFSVDLSSIKQGDVILVEGRLSYYPHGSSITLWGKKVEILKTQEGKNLLEKKKTLEKLDKLGYLDPKRKRPIPKYCKKVAILTAETGAAYQDILKTLHDRFPVDSVLFPCVVQGSEAPKSILSALSKATKGDFDCILLGRGGGSKSDLSCYDDEKLALAIATSPIPIITCIGHTIDTSIADRVSDKSCITPTEAASEINPSLEDVRKKKEDYFSSLNEKMKKILEAKEYALSSFEEKLNYLSLDNRLKMAHERLEKKRKEAILLYEKKIAMEVSSLKDKEHRLASLMSSYVQKKKLSLVSFLEKLNAHSPLLMKEKGFAQIYRNGCKIKSITELKKDDLITIVYSDGRKKALILGENENGRKENQE